MSVQPNLRQFANRIADDPMDRVPPKMRLKINDPQVLFDVHAHVFNHRDIPDFYLGLRFRLGELKLRLMRIFFETLDHTLLNQLPDYQEMFQQMVLTEADILTRLHDVYREMGYTPISSLLMMDMRGIKGKIKRPFEQQKQDLQQLQLRFQEEVLPFLALDPRQNDRLEADFIEGFDRANQPFFGIKLYPSLGYLPSHPRLMAIFELCEAKGIPITCHCSSARVKTSDEEVHVQGMAVDQGQFTWVDEVRSFHEEEDYRQFFNHPRNWIPVLTAFPNLKLNLAHMAGEDEWKVMMETGSSDWVNTVFALLQKYPNVYADFSYTFYEDDYSARLSELMADDEAFAGKVLFGSDFFLSLLEGQIERKMRRFKNILGAERFHLIAQENPRKFLFGRPGSPTSGGVAMAASA